MKALIERVATAVEGVAFIRTVGRSVVWWWKWTVKLVDVRRFFEG